MQEWHSPIPGLGQHCQTVQEDDDFLFAVPEILPVNFASAVFNIYETVFEGAILLLPSVITEAFAVHFHTDDAIVIPPPLAQNRTISPGWGSPGAIVIQGHHNTR